MVIQIQIGILEQKTRKEETQKIMIGTPLLASPFLSSFYPKKKGATTNSKKFLEIRWL
jgi:hypothetical protein